MMRRAPQQVRLIEDHAHLQAVMLVEVVWVLFVVKLVWPSTW